MGLYLGGLVRYMHRYTVAIEKGMYLVKVFLGGVFFLVPSEGDVFRMCLCLNSTRCFRLLTFGRFFVEHLDSVEDKLNLRWCGDCTSCMSLLFGVDDKRVRGAPLEEAKI